MVSRGICVFIPSFSCRASSAARTEAGRCVHRHSKGGFARLVPDLPDCIGWAHTEDAAGNTSHDSTGTSVFSIHIVCSHTKIFLVVYFTGGGKIQMKHFAEKEEFVHIICRGFSPPRNMEFLYMWLWK